MIYDAAREQNLNLAVSGSAHGGHVLARAWEES
jgi:hypothetical protein